MRGRGRIGFAGLALVIGIWTVRCGTLNSVSVPRSTLGRPQVVMAMDELAVASELADLVGHRTPAAARQGSSAVLEGQVSRDRSTLAMPVGFASPASTRDDRDTHRSGSSREIASALASPSPTLMPPATATPTQTMSLATGLLAGMATPTTRSTTIPLPTPGPSATPKPSPTPTLTPVPPTATPTNTPAPTLPPTANPPTPKPVVVSAAASAIDPAEAAVFAELNRRRVEIGLPELRPAPALFASAHAHSLDQAVAGFFGHTGSDGSDAGARMRAAGYSWANWGEAVGRSKAGDIGGIVDALFNSPSHHEILFTTAFTEGGAGVAYAQNGAPYWTIDVANPRGG